MPDEAVPRCPDCTYVLTGLTVPRCPECGLEFHPRLLTEPALARPRPAWERRPRVSRLRAARDTLINVTFRPSSFFASIQQPNRLRRSIYWVGLILALIYLVVVAYIFIFTRLLPFMSGFGGPPPFQRWGVTLLVSATPVVAGVLLVLVPLVTMLLLADLLLWRDRGRFRLFFKASMYSMTVYLWLALAICTIRTGLETCGTVVEIPFLVVEQLWSWADWFMAGAMTWQYTLIYYAVLGSRFATLLPPRPGRKAVSALLVIAAWFGSIYLTLLDNYVGLRFGIAEWNWGLI